MFLISKSRNHLGVFTPCLAKAGFGIRADKLEAVLWRVLYFAVDLLLDSSILRLSRKYSSFLALSTSLLRSSTKLLIKLDRFAAHNFGDDIFIVVS